MGISGTIAATAAIASAGTSIYNSISQARKKTPTPGDQVYIPPPPDTTLQQANDANTAALVGQRARQRAQASSMQAQTILTGPKGVTNASAPATKTLLGL